MKRTRKNKNRTVVLNGNPFEDVVGLSRAVRVGPYVSVGGTASVGEDGATVGIGDAGAQAAQCFKIAGEALERAGAGWEDVMRTRLILTNIDDWKAVVDVRKSYCLAAQPVDTIMQVVRFVNPEWLVEIEVDAVIAE